MQKRNTKVNRQLNTIQNNDIQIAYQIAKEQGLNFYDFYEIMIGYFVECVVTNIIGSRVFVKIQYVNKNASIHIGELVNCRVKNIYDFEYNGKKLRQGLILIAKVISIDEKYGINLSLKNVDKLKAAHNNITNSAYKN